MKKGYKKSCALCNDGKYVYDIDVTCDVDTIKEMMQSILNCVYRCYSLQLLKYEMCSEIIGGEK